MKPHEIALYVLTGEQHHPEQVPLNLTRESNGECTATAHHSRCLLYFRIIQLPDCWIWHTRFIVHRKMELIARPAGSITFLWLAWKNQLVYTIEGFPKQRIQPGCYNIYYQPPGTGWAIHFDKAGTWETFNVLFIPSSLSKWQKANTFPLLQPFLHEATRGKTAFLSSRHLRLTSWAKRLVGNMISPPPGITSSSAYYKNNVSAFFWHTFTGATVPEKIALSLLRTPNSVRASLQPLEITGKEKDGIISFRASSSFGEVELRITSLDSGYLWESYYQINKALTLSLSADIPFLGLVYALKNDLRYKARRIREGLLLKDHYNMFFTPSIQVVHTFPEPGLYATLAIQLSPASLEEWQGAFPPLKTFLTKVHRHIPAQITPEHRFAIPRISRSIEHLLSPPDSPSHKKDIYLEVRAKNLLLDSFEGITSGIPVPPLTLRPDEIKNIRKSITCQLDNPHTTLTVAELAHMAGMNVPKFETGFQQIYPAPVSAFLRQARLLKAQKLLEETGLPVSQVAYETGYKNHSSFTTAFTRQFGKPPKFFRRK